MQKIKLLLSKLKSYRLPKLKLKALKTILYILAAVLSAILSFYVLIEYRSEAGFYSSVLMIVFAGACLIAALESFIDYCCEGK